MPIPFAAHLARKLSLAALPLIFPFSIDWNAAQVMQDSAPYLSSIVYLCTSMLQNKLTNYLAEPELS